MSELATTTPSPRARWTVGALLGLAAFAGVLVTRADYGLAIDEATYLWVAREERLWFAELPERGLAASLSPEGIARRWHFLEPPFSRPEAPHSNFNLPLAQHLLTPGYLLAGGWLGERDASRLGSGFLFGLAIAAAYAMLAKHHGPLAGLFAAAFLAISPRIFAHAHLAATETPMSALWTMTLFSFADFGSGDRRPSWRRAAGAAILAGLAMSVKLTAWTMWPAIAAWLLLARPRGGIRLLLACVLLPLLVVLALTPNLWHDPIHGLWSYLETARENPWKIAGYYSGAGYDRAPPLESGVVLFALTTPITILVLSPLATALRPADRIVSLFALSLVSLLLVRTLGWMPTHDVERQFLPCHYFACVLSGIGASILCGGALRRGPGGPTVRAALSVIVGAAILVEPAADFWKYRAFGLSYYNRAIGGLRGAASAGMEVSYWYEAATDSVWREMLAKLPPGSRLFLRPDHPGLAFLEAWGVWRPDLRSVGPNDADYWLLYGKRAAYLVPDPASGELLPTDLLELQKHAPAMVEVRFDGVRLLALVPKRPMRPREP